MTVPSATVPVMVYQNVEVPFVARTCPAEPVALLESRSSPVRRSLAIVLDARDAVVAVKADAVVVARVVKPFEVNEDVAVILPPVIVPPVRVVKNEVTPWMMEAMRPVVVVVALIVADPADKVPLTVADEILVVARLVCPETVSVVAEAFPRDEVPEVSVENIPVVNVGLGVTPIVEVPEKTMLDPAVRYVTGDVKNVCQFVVEAVSGTLYPACVLTVNVCTPVEVAVVISIAKPFDDEVANVCPATVLPLMLVTPPPAPASAPQENVPFAQRSLSEESEQFASPAPKSAEAIVRFVVVLLVISELLA